MRIDLHTHSRVSDGTDSPADLVRSAAAAGLDVVALTDHDTADGWAEAAETALKVGVGFVPGIEISTRHHGHGVHLLAYLVDPSDPALAAELARIRGGRTHRLPLMVERLNELGIDLTVEEVLAGSADATSSGRPHVADALVARGVVADRSEAFDRFLGAGRPAHVDRYSADLLATLALVRDAGGVSVIAHPWGRSGRRQPDATELARLQQAGLVGLEADHQDHDAEVRRELRGIAAELDLIVTGSSDYHGTGKVGHPLGVNTTAPAEYERLMAAARRQRSGTAHGTP